MQTPSRRSRRAARAGGRGAAVGRGGPTAVRLVGRRRPAPKAALAPEGDREPPAWTASAAWLGLLLLIGFLSLSPSAGAWSRASWPEQVGTLGLVGWWATGALTLIVASLLLLAVVGRVGTVLVAIGRLFRRPPAKSKSTASMPTLPESSGS